MWYGADVGMRKLNHHESSSNGPAHVVPPLITPWLLPDQWDTFRQQEITPIATA
jgi:hypothetical protein